ncbi:hypothetical protein OKA05_06880 [Luteolibacter arcticus]|uniref:Zinc ribbon domain-containing protein n=1 Tax=Luteolibacter arcticus TaxID=1581411 RepID=A0ABT3GF79_9BACT|nr:hypothetical protein [Luteolibacter arcticus]MCW1922271.1 hypothetical protein [Luteolibacter arcticus]
MEYLLYILPIWCAMSVIGYFIGHSRGAGGDGAILGFLLGPIGWLFALAIPDKRPKCPLCLGALPAVNVVRCLHCGGEIAGKVKIPVAPERSPAANPTIGPRPSVDTSAASPIERKWVDPLDEWEQQERVRQGILPPLGVRDQSDKT